MQLFDLRSVLLLCGDSVTDTGDRFDVPIGYNNLENGISANEIPITHGQSLLCNVYKQISADSAFARAVEFPPGAGLPPPKTAVVRRTDRFKNHRLICVPSASKCSVQTLSYDSDHSLIRLSKDRSAHCRLLCKCSMFRLDTEDRTQFSYGLTRGTLEDWIISIFLSPGLIRWLKYFLFLSLRLLVNK